MPTVEAVGGDGAGASVMEASTTDFNPTPMNAKAVGIGGSSDDGDGMTTITPIDAEIVADDERLKDGPGPDIPGAPTGKVSDNKESGQRHQRPDLRARPAP